jgi:hypothetical protein
MPARGPWLPPDSGTCLQPPGGQIARRKIPRLFYTFFPNLREPLKQKLPENPMHPIAAGTDARACAPVNSGADASGDIICNFGADDSYDACVKSPSGMPWRTRAPARPRSRASHDRRRMSCGLPPGHGCHQGWRNRQKLGRRPQPPRRAGITPVSSPVMPRPHLPGRPRHYWAGQAGHGRRGGDHRAHTAVVNDALPGSLRRRSCWRRSSAP